MQEQTSKLAHAIELSMSSLAQIMHMIVNSQYQTLVYCHQFQDHKIFQHLIRKFQNQSLIGIVRLGLAQNTSPKSKPCWWKAFH